MLPFPFSLQLYSTSFCIVLWPSYLLYIWCIQFQNVFDISKLCYKYTFTIIKTIIYVTVLFSLRSNETRGQKYVPKLSLNCLLSFLSILTFSVPVNFSINRKLHWGLYEGLTKYMCVHIHICMFKRTGFSLWKDISNWFLQGITSTHKLI